MYCICTPSVLLPYSPSAARTGIASRQQWLQLDSLVTVSTSSTCMAVAKVCSNRASAPSSWQRDSSSSTRRSEVGEKIMSVCGPLRRSATGCDRGALSGAQLDRAEGTGHRQRRCAHRRCAHRSRRLRSHTGGSRQPGHGGPRCRRSRRRPAPHNSHPADSGYGTLMDRGGEGCDRGRACDRCSVRRSVGALPAPVRGIGSVQCQF